MKHNFYFVDINNLLFVILKINCGSLIVLSFVLDFFIINYLIKLL